MDTLIQREIRQKRPLPLGELVFLNLVRTTEVLARAEADLLKSRELSFAQYNVLRILRGADEALSCGEISDRMVKRDPDVTRLLDRLVARGLVSRERSAHDRRVVISRITTAGRKLVAELDAPLERLHREQSAHLSEEDLHQLVQLLERLRRPE